MRIAFALPSWLALLVASTLVAEEHGRAEEHVQAMVSAEVLNAARVIYDSVSTATGLERVLGFSRAEGLIRSLDDDARLDLAYWPRNRVGLRLAYMNRDQRRALHDLLSSVLSSKGHLKVVQIMQLEKVLQALDQGGLPRSMEEYALAFFGEPSLEHSWAWRFEGHHVSLNVTLVPGKVNVTPSFLGANPSEIGHGPLSGYRTLAGEEDLGRALVKSLSRAQRAQAILDGEPPADLFSGTLGKKREQWAAWKTELQPEGIAFSALSEPQRHLLQRLLDEILGTYRPELAGERLEAIDLESLSFAWIGEIERGEPHYYRIQGGDFLFELDNVQGGGNHVHTVWRDRLNDFGEDLLKKHYDSHH